MAIERNRFFAGKLLHASDLADEQLYLLERGRRHNRMLHGWGIVCGLGVRPGPARHELTVEPGYALDPRGDEIVVAEEVIVDLRTEDDDGNAVSPCPPPEGDERKRVRRKRPPDRPLLVAIRHAECPANPVPVDDSVEYGRTRESFAITLLSRLPASYRRRRARAEPDGRPCPDPRGEPWVILAEIVLDARVRVSTVDCERHARRVGPHQA